jgi:hypothetical protein
MTRNLKTAALAFLALLIVSIALAHSDGIYNPSANNVGNFEGIDSNKASGAATLPLDGITTGIKAAYSTRKLLTAYAGNAIQVQETTGNTTSNIGFVANVLDTTTLSTFCSGKTCKVITWYDQSGGGFNQTQATIANAPIIFQSGAVNAINTKPAVLFVAASSTSLANTSLSANSVNTLFENAVVSINLTNGAVVGPSVNGGLIWRVDSTGPMELLYDATASLVTSSSNVSAATGAVIEVQYNDTSKAYSFFINAASAGSGTGPTLGGLTAATQMLSLNRNGESLDGSLGEVILYDLVGGIPSGSRTSIEANQKTYWGTP